MLLALAVRYESALDITALAFDLSRASFTGR
jgi:hypothetical protein